MLKAHMKKREFNHKDILTADQFSRDDLVTIVETAQEMKKMVQTRGTSNVLKGRVMTALFYEASSRTFGSFVGAMTRLGGGVIPLQGVTTYSSVSKGESLPDTVRTFASYSDVIVLRHPEIGSAKIAAEFCEKPIINAGDGVGEHPTQALLDFFTIHKHFGSLEGLTVTMVGDLLNGRTIHSLSKLLSLFPKVSISLVSPEILKMPLSLIEQLKKRGIKVSQSDNIEDVLGETDVLYVTRVQKERFTDLDVYEKTKFAYIVTPTLLKRAKKTAIIMHPFPRVGEITMDVDLDPRALYIREQMPNGMYVRMALLSLLLDR